MRRRWRKWSWTTRFHFLRFVAYCLFAIPDMVWMRDWVAIVSLMSIVALIETAASVFTASRAQDEAEKGNADGDHASAEESQ